MTKHKALWMALAMVVTLATGRMAFADNVVVSPTNTPAAQPVQPVQPVQSAQPVATVPAATSDTHTVNENSRRTEVHTDASPPRNYVGTIAVSALMGALAGGLIGGAIYLLDNQEHPYNIAYWAAGGVLVGTGVGIAQIVVQENRASQAVSLNRLPSDPAPTFRLAFFKATF